MKDKIIRSIDMKLMAILLALTMAISGIASNTYTIHADEDNPYIGTADASEYQVWADTIKDVVGSNIANTAIVKAKDPSKTLNFNMIFLYTPTDIIPGPDGYYFLDFSTVDQVDKMMDALSDNEDVAYAARNYNIVNEVSLQSGEKLKGTLNDSLGSTIRALTEAKKEDAEDSSSSFTASDLKGFKAFEDFYNLTNGKRYDLDNYAGAQCVDGARYYLQWLGYDYSPRGDAKDYWLNRKTNGILESCIEVNLGERLQDGDILVYGPFTGNPYGHISIYHQGMSYGQNQGTPESVVYTEGGPFNEILSYTATPNLLGALRPKCYRYGSNKYIIDVINSNEITERELQERLALYNAAINGGDIATSTDGDSNLLHPKDNDSDDDSKDSKDSDDSSKDTKKEDLEDYSKYVCTRYSSWQYDCVKPDGGHVFPFTLPEGAQYKEDNSD